MTHQINRHASQIRVSVHFVTEKKQRFDPRHNIEIFDGRQRLGQSAQWVTECRILGDPGHEILLKHQISSIPKVETRCSMLSVGSSGPGEVSNLIFGVAVHSSSVHHVSYGHPYGALSIRTDVAFHREYRIVVTENRTLLNARSKKKKLQKRRLHRSHSRILLQIKHLPRRLLLLVAPPTRTGMGEDLHSRAAQMCKGMSVSFQHSYVLRRASSHPASQPLREFVQANKKKKKKKKGGLLRY
ncbi:hypothetical protein VTO42DRAFT_2502 [Malbranchea cinnamomea]